MKLPKIIFREMTLEENIQIIKWAYFENNDSLDVHKQVIEYFPLLASIDNSLSRKEIYDIIEDIVTKDYQKYQDRIKSETDRYNLIWSKYNDNYFEKLSNYLNIECSEKLDTIEAIVGLIPVFPRYLDSFIFALSTGLKDSEVIRIAAHESLHFIWFEKWKQLYTNSSRREYDSPYITWKYSEMVTDPILNSKEINSILNVNEKTYDSFYEIKDGDSNLMDNLKEIYESDKLIEEKITEGFDYIKSVLENKTKQR